MATPVMQHLYFDSLMYCTYFAKDDRDDKPQKLR